MELKERNLINYLNKLFPPSLAEKWDFVGYSLQNKKNFKKLKVLICLDVNNFIIDKAIKNDISLIISFHPFKFGSTWKEIYEQDIYKKDQVNILKKNNINVFSIHTNFDVAKKGTKYWFLKQLGLLDKVIKEYKYAYHINYLSTTSKFVSLLKQKFKINNVITNIDDEEKKINNFYIAPGASNVYEFLKLKNKDLVLVTSDIKWNEQQKLNDLGFKFIMIPHKTEDVFIDALKSIIESNFKSIIIETIHIEDFWKVY